MTSIRLPLLLMTSLVLPACAHMPFSGSAEPEQAAPLEQPQAMDPPRQDDVLFPGLVLAAKPAVTELKESDAAYPNDLWARIREGYKIDADLDDPRVVAKVDRYSRNQRYLDRVTERAEPYLHYIVEAIEARDLPMELALLPVVESGYRPFAYSHGRAAGVWQFVPGTARHYGLRRSWWYDGRRDVIASTEAALDYLERLGEMFEDDWLLALAAYNAGEGRVLAAIRQAAANGEPTDYWNLALPQETRKYVPRLLAASALVKDPRAYDIELTSIPDQPYLKVVELDGQIDLAVAADLADMSVEELYRLNPGFDRWATDPDGPHRLAVPVNKAGPLEAKLADLPREARMRWHRHEIKPGDSLEAIARQYHTTVRTLQKANDINGHIIRAGSHLMIPAASANAGAPSHSAGNRLSPRHSQGRQGQRVEYTVQPGDTLWAIARRHGVEVQQVAYWNSVAPADPLRPGQQLVLWVGEQGDVRRAGAAPPASLPVMQSVSYRVRRGDTLYTIAREFGVSVQDLRRWNDLAPNAYLQPGDTLLLEIDVRKQDRSI